MIFQKMGKALVRPVWLGAVAILTAKDGYEIAVMVIDALKGLGQ